VLSLDRAIGIGGTGGTRRPGIEGADLLVTPGMYAIRINDICQDRHGDIAYGMGDIMLRWHTIEGICWLSIPSIQTIVPFRGMKVGSMLTEYAYVRAKRI
jgi:hypothetical protein